MVNKIGVFAGGMVLGMLVLVACEPFYQNLTEMKDLCLEKIMSVKTKAKTSYSDVKQKVNQLTDEALDMMDDKIDDLIEIIDSIDISKLKGKSKIALETIKQKMMTLKQ